MRVQFGQHNPVDRRRWRHEINFVILSTCVLQVRRISFLDPSSQKTLLRMTTREKTLLRMTTREKTLLRMTTREKTLLRMTTREINLHIALHRHSEGAERPKNLDPSRLRRSG